MSTTTVTNNFVSRNAAITFYKRYGITKDAVKAKIIACEINVGVPTLKKHESVSLDSDGKYVITTE